ncbi:ABC transporter permease/substrate-binding protein [Lapidilactobacillus bayanensis]|uniref:ABC transporter permease/substrate-binding protein n=1 Tax=Lapidilactobacillus bayanensis TaxID=2485998 RepID=UPI000F79E42C|nr:ABC transporter permease/substrate-binding protein [Lapidilactobacillus bayanensis]
MADIGQTLIERRTDLIQALLQHIQISLLSLVIAMLIAIPLAIAVTNHQKLAEFFLQIAGVLQTIPSLALLGLLIPIVGIGNVPATIALVIYAILPIFQNTYLGITNIEPSLKEAAEAFGMSRWQKLFRVELPLAMPEIIAGVRNALVLIIGTATLAALIGAGGLGTFILLGINRNNTALTLIGAISAALLAIVFSWLINVLQRVKLRYSLTALALIVVGSFGYTGYQAYQAAQPTITIAGKLGSEPDILINMYRDLIKQDSPRTKVVLKSNFGQTSFLLNALKSDQIDIYPEFTGTVLEGLVKLPTGQTVPHSAAKTYQLSAKLLQQQANLAYLKPMAYNNTYAIIVTKQFARQYDLKSISDLTKIANKINAGFDLEFSDRQDGYKGLQKTYGLTFKTKTMDPSLRYEAIQRGSVNLIDGYSTDSEIRRYNLVALKDDRQLFPYYQGAPLMRAATAKKYPQVVKSLNKLHGQITDVQMRQMNYEVNVEKKSAATVAKHYLLKHHLLRGQ